MVEIQPPYIRRRRQEWEEDDLWNLHRHGLLVMIHPCLTLDRTCPHYGLVWWALEGRDTHIRDYPYGILSENIRIPQTASRSDAMTYVHRWGGLRRTVLIVLAQSA